MADKKVQRIRLRVKGSPVKLDASILEMNAACTELKVRFDGPLDDMLLYRYTDNLLVSRKLSDGESPAHFTSDQCQLFEVL